MDLKVCYHLQVVGSPADSVMLSLNGPIFQVALK